jgi:gamma-glutamylcyclotransferase (GGCT)/AIG2-like uncharacterized protein YtfP
MDPAERTVFVYGTLKPGGHYYGEFCEGRLAAEPQPAKIRGELYDLQVGYPGLRLRGQDWVYGYLMVMASAAELRRLDQLEGFAPDRPKAENEYNRLKVPCFDRTGEPLGTFWTYEMTPSTLARHPAVRLPDGDWPISGRA